MSHQPKYPMWGVYTVVPPPPQCARLASSKSCFLYKNNKFEQLKKLVCVEIFRYGDFRIFGFSKDHLIMGHRTTFGLRQVHVN